jgi:hypothetical protein
MESHVTPPADASAPALDALAADAAVVCAHFVQMRGGSPFLSGADGQQLHAWLTSGVPVASLLRAIEDTAARRVARRMRTPFTLRSIRGSLTQGGRTARPRERSAPEAASLPVFTACDDADALAKAVREALAARTETDVEARARAGCAIVRGFHERLWDLLGPTLPELRAGAAAALAEARDDVDAELFDAMCDEWVRARLRERYPDLTATRMWEEADGG